MSDGAFDSGAFDSGAFDTGTSSTSLGRTATTSIGSNSMLRPQNWAVGKMKEQKKVLSPALVGLHKAKGVGVSRG